ncbi:2,4'-dihydroxyacetophenone dioxygenase family protein [Acidovorax cavernicola]|uniref:Cupin domain-containing protein n=1 Tax=Acidovorax cavernicola TaxID=1675792 RepID=A0A9X8GRU4_9BURK|nr:2,4'-dihydroxyacetophenone dioxygenase family protein [Acidovorax cavernicola]RIX70689.1 cupin domain-containing protein [Acidovorax cavernicola]
MLFERIDTECINDDETPWMPYTPYDENTLVKYFKIDPVRGESIVMLKSPPRGKKPKHHHTGTVIVYTIQGAWKYIEHDWTARAGSVVYETAGTVHTPIGVSDEATITLSIVTGELLYLDDDNKIIAQSNWKTNMERYLNHCKKHGITPKDLSTFAV